MMIFPHNKADSNTIQIIAFGKGVGESFLIHIGCDRYILIDSFINAETKNPVCLDYLYNVGLDESAIVGVVCSHWDDDHVKGMSLVLNRIKNDIDVCIPLLLSKRDIATFLAFHENARVESNSSSEFVKVWRLKETKTNMRFVFASSKTALFDDKLVEIGKEHSSIISLSPTNDDVEHFIKDIILPKNNTPMVSTNITSNAISTVTLITGIVDGVLFGGDLENDNHAWDEIAKRFCYDKCHIFKVPHHGSENAFCRDIWGKVVEKPISLITRYNRSSLPKDEMVNQILQESSCVYILGGEKSREKKHTLRCLRGTVADVLSRIEIRDKQIGIVRLSWNDKEWSVEQFGAVECIIPPA